MANKKLYDLKKYDVLYMGYDLMNLPSLIKSKGMLEKTIEAISVITFKKLKQIFIHLHSQSLPKCTGDTSDTGFPGGYDF